MTKPAPVAVAHVTVPVDFQSVPIKSGKRSERNVAGHVSELMVYSSRMPSEPVACETSIST